MDRSNVIDLDGVRRRCGQLTARQLCLPAGIDPLEREHVDAIVRRRRALPAGARLYHEGDPLAHVYVAHRGAFKTVALAENGDEAILAFHLPGELIGLDALGADAHRGSAVALEDAEVCELRFDELLTAAARLPRLQQQLLRVIGQGVERDHRHVGMLLRRQAHERVAAFLHDLGERHRRLGLETRELRLPMSREDIAGFLGLALETVSRSLTRLQEDGIVAVRGRRLEVLAPARLAALAAGAEAAAGARAGR
ncbi:helix-turn-helix domain-containing protein [Vulcaniibacterium thermophilum]|uniref:CRP-like protein Clp n=1 Tax=Vulcaniibacterium thermophilum TaxID=1169913 RepID=A0A919DDF2_9GAMM|nr:helix-turn-helix domain-containing protein [Vulcaniibacterium thermophilum]GHE35681.1 transcriptional regulator FNR [Vulcaniibacterium thermophilum]